MKKMRKMLCLILGVMMIMSLLTGCGSGSKSSYDYEESSYDYEGAYAEEAYSNSWAASTAVVTDDYDYGYESTPAEAGKAEASETAAAVIDQSKLIYRSDIDIETTSYDEIVGVVKQLVEQNGGYIENSSTYDYGGYRNAYYTVRVPQANYRGFVTSASGLEMVVSFNESVENVSSYYYDTELRLESAKKELEGYQALYAQATDVDDMITIAAAINNVQYEIDSLSGTLRYYDALVSYSTVSISISEVSKLRGTETPAIGFGARFVQALKNGWHNGVDGVEELLIGIANGWLGWLIFIIIVYVVYLLIRKQIRKNKEKKQKAIADYQAMMAAQQQGAMPMQPAMQNPTVQGAGEFANNAPKE